MFLGLSVLKENARKLNQWLRGLYAMALTLYEVFLYWTKTNHAVPKTTWRKHGLGVQTASPLVEHSKICLS